MRKVLIIDDDAAMRRMVARTLTAEHYEVTEAADGRKGVEAFRNTAPAVVVTDIVMPDQDGVQTIREIRACGHDTLIIAMSGGGTCADGLYLKIAKVIGADAVLAKPFRPAELVALIGTLTKPYRTAA